MTGTSLAQRRRKLGRHASLFSGGEPMVWLTGGALVLSVVMILGLLLLVLWFGLSTFWPQPVAQLETASGQLFMGELTRGETVRHSPASPGALPTWTERELIRTGNYKLTQRHFHWVDSDTVARRTYPKWALVLERLEWGRFYGFPEALAQITAYVPDKGRDRAEVLAEARQRALSLVPSTPGAVVRVVVSKGEDRRLITVEELETTDDRIIGVAEVVQGPAAAWAAYERLHETARDRSHERRGLEKHDLGAINLRQEEARLLVRERELALDAARRDLPPESTRVTAAAQALKDAQQTFTRVEAETLSEFGRVRAQIQHLNQENARDLLQMRTAGEDTAPGQTVLMQLDGITRAYPANQLSALDRLGVYLSRWWEYLWDEPREANSEGGVFPAIFGTVLMTLIMSVIVVPFGVLAALYMREYAKKGLLLSTVRIAVNNLAGVPSIVFGVFGLGFFCYMIGASIDELLFEARLPNPTFGKGGLLWAALTLSLLTLPVVIVATEEALSAVPGSLREASYACGATKWQTIRRVVLPQAMPGIITGMILAMARGAGEVAPLMLVGAVKLAPELPVDGVFPFMHLQRSFMHLGFHIYDVGFQSQNSEAAKPMVFTTTLLLISLVAVLNFSAVWLRSRLQRRYVKSKF